MPGTVQPQSLRLGRFAARARSQAQHLGRTLSSRKNSYRDVRHAPTSLRRSQRSRHGPRAVEYLLRIGGGAAVASVETVSVRRPKIPRYANRRHLPSDSGQDGGFSYRPGATDCQYGQRGRCVGRSPKKLCRFEPSWPSPFIDECNPPLPQKSPNLVTPKCQSADPAH